MKTFEMTFFLYLPAYAPYLLLWNIAVYAKRIFTPQTPSLQAKRSLCSFRTLNIYMFQPYEVAGSPPLFPPQSSIMGFILFFVPKNIFLVIKTISFLFRPIRTIITQACIARIKINEQSLEQYTRDCPFHVYHFS